MFSNVVSFGYVPKALLLKYAVRSIGTEWAAKAVPARQRRPANAWEACPTVCVLILTVYASLVSMAQARLATVEVDRAV